MTTKPAITLAELQRSCEQVREGSRRSTITAALHQTELHDSMSTQKLLLRKKDTYKHLEPDQTSVGRAGTGCPTKTVCREHQDWQL